MSGEPLACKKSSRPADNKDVSQTCGQMYIQPLLHHCGVKIKALKWPSLISTLMTTVATSQRMGRKELGEGGTEPLSGMATCRKWYKEA